ncbi:uncharacterized protein LOC128232247 [Mya arenaria]|uniref:uncharacterized protein LOC128232247 n=1 Tax=Mya arenaria TaxID=6604 RepID=UPI0022E153BA|nr:uncharacterized protein LOC128232247 [Mya arenaria]
MLSFPAMLCHAVIWIIVFVSTNGQGTPISSQRISAMGNRRMQRLNATQQSTGTGVSSTTTPTLVPAIPRLPRRLLGRWNRRRFQDTTTNPDATTTTIGSLKAARQRQGAERKLQRRMFRRQRLREKENRLLEKIKAKTEKLLPSPPSLPSQNMLQTVDVAAGDLKNSTNSSDSSSKSQLSSWEQQKRKMIEKIRKKQVKLDARIAAAKRAIEIVKLREIRKDRAKNKTNSLIDSINLNINSQIHLTHSDGSISNASLPQSDNVNILTEASATSPNPVPQSTNETTSTPLVNHSNARLGLESPLHQTHSIANIGDPLVPGMELGPGESIPLGIPMNFVPVDLNPFLSNVVAKPGASDTKDRRNSLKTEDETLARFWPPRLAITSDANKGQPLLEIENETPIAGHRSGIPLGSSRRVGIKDINHFGEPLGFSKSDSPPPIKRTEFINSILGGLRQHIQFHRTHQKHGSSEPLNIDHLGAPLQPSIGHSGEPLEPTIGHPGDPLQSSFGHAGKPVPTSIGHPGEPLQPLVGDSGEPFQPSIGNPGEPLPPSIGHPGEPLPPLIGNPGEPLRPSIGHPGEPLRPSIGHPGEPLRPSIGHPGEPIRPSIGHLGEPLQPLISGSGEPLQQSISHPGEPLQPSIGHPGEPLRPSIGHHGEPLRPSIGHPGEPIRPSIGHPGEPTRPSIGHLGEPLQPLISNSGEPLQQSIGHPGEPLQPSIGHPGEPLWPLIGNPGEPLQPSIGHPSEPLSPSIGHIGGQLPLLVNNISARETFGNQPVTDTSEPSSNSLNEGVPLQPSLGQPLGESNQGEPIGLGPIGGSEPGDEWADISLGARQPVTQFQDVDLSTFFASDEPTSSSSPGQRQGGIQTLSGGLIPRIERPPESTSSVSGEQIRTQSLQLSQIFSDLSSNLRRP